MGSCVRGPLPLLCGLAAVALPACGGATPEPAPAPGRVPVLLVVLDPPLEALLRRIAEETADDERGPLGPGAGEALRALGYAGD